MSINKILKVFRDIKRKKEFPEFLFKYEGKEFIEQCYQYWLGRAPDPDGLASHLNSLAKGQSKVGICIGISQSPEATRRPQINMNREDSVKGGKNFTITNSKFLNKKEQNREPSVWMDMTNVLEWTGGVVGIIRAELELAHNLKKHVPNLKFSMQVGNGFVEIDDSEMQWLINATDVVGSYLSYFGKDGKSTAHSVKIDVPKGDFYYPYINNDVVFCAGWLDSQKETYFSKLKVAGPKVYVGYLIYDMILMLEETAHFYNVSHKFLQYINWVSKNADFILYGGETAKRDTEDYFIKNKMRIPFGEAIQFGTDIVKREKTKDECAILLKEVGVSSPFVMAVGSIEPRKNYDTLYKAYVYAQEKIGSDLPQLVIVGKNFNQVPDLIDRIARDPRVKERIIMIAPTDDQLAALYQECLFTMLASLYEGWSLTLPESLGNGKFCLTCDTPPLREIGRDMVDYVEPFDVRGWAEKFYFYSHNATELKHYEEKISSSWNKTRWFDSAKMIAEAINKLSAASKAFNTQQEALNLSQEEPTIWMDLTTSFLWWRTGKISGIIRAELTYAHYLKRKLPKTRFFGYDKGHFVEIDEGLLLWLFESSSITQSYANFNAFWSQHENQGTGDRNPLVFGGYNALNKNYLVEIPSNSIVFFAAIDSDGTGNVSRNRDIDTLIRHDSNVLVSQLVYDLTPFICPQFHLNATCVGFETFYKYISNHCDYLLYGGKTAMLDGIKYQKENGLKSPPSDYLIFGSDLSSEADKQLQIIDKEVLKSLGITGDYVIAVGTIEPRKNHETLYKAYLKILKDQKIERPVQMIFIGGNGWNSNDFMQILNNDSRIAGKILHLKPSDSELDILYKNCLFTMLASFYEGWSLTLPESLNYGKFCLASDVAPLRETGRDFVEYIHPLDTFAWADRISFYINNPQELEKRELYIKKEWQSTSWDKATDLLISLLHQAYAKKFEDPSSGAKELIQ
jgi:glycosyltransferase involved in cell wall biosynthesis